MDVRDLRRRFASGTDAQPLPEFTSGMGLPGKIRAALFRPAKWTKATTPFLFAVFFISTVIVSSRLRFWDWPERRDWANWDYFSQVIARGGVPYRDVVNIKTPLSAYIGAAVIHVGDFFGVSDVYAIRMTYVVLAALTVALSFLVASRFFGSVRIGLLAGILLLGIEGFAFLNVGGVQPKTPMVLFGLCSLWATLNDRPFIAGLFGMLSALSWQPGLLFVGVAALGSSSYLTSWRDGRLLRVMGGAAVPLLLLVAHLWAGSALKAFFYWCFHYPLTVYGPRDLTSVAGFLDRFGMLLEKSFRGDRLFFYLAGAGILVALGREVYQSIRQGLKSFLGRARGHQIIVAPLCYFLFCAISLQGEQDLIPLLPFVAIFSAVLLVLCLDSVRNLVSSGAKRDLLLHKAGFAIACIAVLVSAVSSILSIRIPAKRLTAQLADTALISSHLGSDDQIFVHGQTEILVLSGLPNARKYTNLDHGKDGYLDQVEDGGFEGWFDRLKAEPPKIVVLARLKNVDRRKEFLNWVASDYRRMRGRVFTFYVREPKRDHGAYEPRR